MDNKFPNLIDGTGNPLEEAGDVIRQADEVVRGVSGLLGILKGDPRPVEPVVPEKPEPRDGPAEPDDAEEVTPEAN